MGDIEDPSWGATYAHNAQWQANANVISGFIAGVQHAVGYTPGIYVGWSRAASVLDGWGWGPGYFPSWATGSCGPAITKSASNPEPYSPGYTVESDFNGLHSDNQAGVCRPFGQYVLMWQYILSSGGTGYGQDVDYDLTPYQDAGNRGAFPTSY